MAVGAIKCLFSPAILVGGHAVHKETLGEPEGLPATEKRCDAVMDATGICNQMLSMLLYVMALLRD